MPNVKVNLNHVLNKTNIDDFDKFISLKENYNFDFINPLVVKDCQELFFNISQIENYNQKLKYYYELAHSLNIDFLADDINFFDNDVNKYGSRKELDDLKCVCPSYIAFVDAPSGLVYPCDCSLHRDRNIYKIGDLHKKNFEEIWEDEQRKKLCSMLLNSELECRKKCDQANCLFNKKLVRRLNK